MPLAQGRATNLHRPLVERLGLGVLTSFMQVKGRLIEEPSRLCELHAVPLNPRGDGQGVGEQPAAERPVVVLDGREGSVDRTDGPLGPEAAGVVVHRGLEDLLDHAMDAVGLGVPVDANQREAAQRSEQVVDEERVLRGPGEGLLHRRPELRGPAGQELERDGVRGEEGTEPQHIGGGWRFFLHRLEVRRPGRGHRLGISPQGRESCLDEFQATGAIALEIALKGRSSLDDVSRRLLQGEGEPVQLAGKVGGRGSFRGLGILAAATMEQECGRVVDG